MENKLCQYCLFYSWICIVIPLFVLCLVWFLTGVSEVKKIDAYVKADCLVMNSSLVKCGVTPSREGDRQCFRLQWQIKYLQYQSDNQTTITRSESYFKREIRKENALRIELTKYSIGQIYPCYHSPTNRLTEVQWEKPSVKKYTILMILGTVSLFIFIGLTASAIYSLVTICCPNKRKRQNTQIHVRARKRPAPARCTRWIPLVPRSTTSCAEEEENSLSTSSSPSHEVFSDSVENKIAPLTPPPPYES